ncbi:Phosphatidylinositol 4-kinase [Rhynchospora pubera]|uniref:1-phosphatidylinositol 4-kinase n=1 Tax=Rhynchospora pubera TaxID=906938 RepID=A0AAV8HSM1_9POAL|nr:Phosphatidylinositol 4-kinase [Rhynchospora pubera]
MVRLLSLARFGLDEPPREITRSGPVGSSEVGSSGWLIRFFDSAFFCEWIAVSYLYKHEHAGVRDYLCNRMYALPLTGLESYMLQICYMLVHKPSPSLDRFVIDACSKSLRIALKVHWILMAELEDEEVDGDVDDVVKLQEQCQIAATLSAEWPPLVKPPPPSPSPASPKSNPVLDRLRSSKQKLFSLASPGEEGNKNSVLDSSSKNLSVPSEENKLLRRLSIGPQRVRDALFSKKLMDKDEEELQLDGKDRDKDKDGFFKRLLRDSRDKEEDGEDKEGFFKRLLRDSKEEKEREREKSGDEEEREGFLKRILFKDKGEEKKEERDEEGGKSIDDEEREGGFFKRLFKDKTEGGNEDREKINGILEEEERDGFFKRLFKDKNEERTEEEENFFKRLFKDKNEERREEKRALNEEERSSGINNGRGNNVLDEGEKENFFKRLFKDKHEDEADRNASSSATKGIEEEESSEFLSFRKLFRVHPEETKNSASTSGIECSTAGGTLESSPGTESFFKRLFGDRDRSVEDSELFGSKSKEKHPGSPMQSEKHIGKPPLPNNIIAELRKGTYHASLEFVQTLCDTSYGLVDIFPIEDRKIALRESLVEINMHLAASQKSGGVCFPMGKGMYRVVHIPEDEAVLLNSREKAPYLICVEVLKAEAPSSKKASSDPQKLSKGGIPLANGDAQLPKPPPWAYPLWSRHESTTYDSNNMLKSTSQAIDQAMAHLWEAKVKFVTVGFSIERLGRSRSNRESEQGSNEGEIMEWVKVNLTAVPGVSMEDVGVDQEPRRKKEHRRIPSTIAIEEVKAAAAKGHAPPGLPLKGAGQDSQDVLQKPSDGGVPKPTDALSGELWEVKKDRIRRSSVHGKLPGWDLRSVIVKSGDDCRQEHLAVQLVSHFYDIYQEAGLPLWLRPYEVLVTSSYTALIETIPDTASIHSIKSRFSNVSSLRDYYIAKYEENSQNFKLAQRNFVESMAGYSILCYLLQVKDRHNGNLLIDEEGHIIHIDFGFMLSNSPGGVNFESAPFKLTRELLEVMDSDAEGTPSEFFDYFKVLCIQGFLTCRKHAERIILLVEMLQDSGFPCFKGGPRTIQNLRKRFHLSLTEEQCVSLVLSLISSSLDAWRTRQYDYYQRVLNGIL